MKKFIYISLLYWFFISNLAAYRLDGNSLIPGAEITSSAIEAGRAAMNVVAENVANEHTTRDVDGKPYQARVVSFQAQQSGESQVALKKVGVASIAKDSTPGARIYNPSHPHADEEGYVTHSNVRAAQEMVNMIKYSRWVEAEYAVANASIKIAENAFMLGR